MEKIRPWCGKPSDRGRLKNRTSFCEMWPRNHKALRNCFGKTRAGIAQFDLDRTLDRQLQWSIASLGTRSSRVSVYSIGVKIWQQTARLRSIPLSWVPLLHCYTSTVVLQCSDSNTVTDISLRIRCSSQVRHFERSSSWRTCQTRDAPGESRKGYASSCLI